MTDSRVKIHVPETSWFLEPTGSPQPDGWGVAHQKMGMVWKKKSSGQRGQQCYLGWLRETIGQPQAAWIVHTGQDGPMLRSYATSQVLTLSSQWCSRNNLIIQHLCRILLLNWPQTEFACFNNLGGKKMSAKLHSVHLQLLFLMVNTLSYIFVWEDHLSQIISVLLIPIYFLFF